MTITTRPPSKWLNKEEGPLNLYDRLIRKSSDKNKKLAVVVNKSREKTIITQKIALHKSRAIAKNIKDLTLLEGNEQLRIFGVLSASEASFYLMLASCFLGANHCICFEDLSETSITSRINIFEPHIIIGTKNTTEKLAEAVKISDFKDTPILDITNIETVYPPDEDHDFAPAHYKSNDILFTLFTSGSTGLPKAIRHTASRYSRYAEATSKHFFGLNQQSTIFTATDAGWINGHTYAFYGPLLCNSTTVISERLSEISKPDYLEFILTECRVTCFYASVTLLRAIRKNALANKSVPSLKSLSNLERIGSCGEPLANDIGSWIIDYLSPTRKSIVNTYFQTETGGVLTAPRDEDGFNFDYSNVGKPSCFIEIKSASELLSTQELEDESIDPDELLVPYPWDGIFHSVISDRPTKYFTNNGFYRLHDTGHFGSDGSLFIGGRSDDVMNVAGHRIGSSEIENTVIQISGIFESCAVAIPDETMGSSIALFYSASTQIDPSKVRRKIREILSEYHQPQYIFKFNNLPKTKSGKIMRRIMRNLAENGSLDPAADYSTFINRDDFIKDCASFLEFWIERTIGTKARTIFDLDNFCSEMQIESVKHLALPSLVVAVLQTLEDWHLELSRTDQLNLSLKSMSGNLYTCDVDINETKSITSIFKDITDSDIGMNSCLYDTAALLMSCNHTSNASTHISLIREQDSNFFKIGIKIKSFSSNAIKKQIVRDLLDSMSATIKDKPRRDLRNSDMKQTLETQSESSTEITSAERSDKRCLPIRCHKCQVSLSQLNQERGLEGYLLPIIRSDNKKTYICDLCAAGW
tara:strand:+ start:2899 stop:5337 length:2439 start_codon:yes stop_codon:yes gene_type:complete